jgi:hypothetical protein
LTKKKKEMLQSGDRISGSSGEPCMFDRFHNLNVSLRHTKVSTPAADWGLVFCMAQGHGYHCKKIEHAAVHRMGETMGF